MLKIADLQAHNALWAYRSAIFRAQPIRKWLVYYFFWIFSPLVLAPHYHFSLVYICWRNSEYIYYSLCHRIVRRLYFIISFFYLSFSPENGTYSGCFNSHCILLRPCDNYVWARKALKSLWEIDPLMCVDIFWGDNKSFTVTQAVHWQLYIVSKLHSFSVVPRKYVIKQLQKWEWVY